MARHVRKGDTVVVTAGESVGKSGKVLEILTKHDKVIVEGVNMVYRHIRPTQENPQGGRIRKEMPIHISNVSPMDPETGKATRVRFETRKDGAKVRVAARSGKELSTLKKAK